VILIIGQTSLHWGRMEFGNIGNYYIIEPFIRELHKVFPNTEIETTLQMSEQFCIRENIKVLPLELYYDFNSSKNLEKAKNELELVEEYLTSANFKEKTPYIEEVLKADFVIDFSGDMWGDNANFLGKDRFEVGLYKDLIAQKLRPTFMIAGSPGPFKNERTKELAKEVYRNFALVTNREAISTDFLKKEGFDVQNTKNFACPSFLFQSQFDFTIEEIDEFLKNGKPIVGFIMCGWNFTTGPYDKWPRKDEDYYIYAEALEYLTNTYETNLIIMSHSNGFPIPPEEFKLQHGRDYPIIKQLENILVRRGKAKNYRVLNGIYTPHETKCIIGKCDMMISGRLHGAVAALSQEIPTVIIDYGHEPKAHKLRGIAELCEVEEYLVDPNQSNDLIKKVDKCFNDRFELKKHLTKRIPIVKQLAESNFIEIKNTLIKLGIIN